MPTDSTRKTSRVRGGSKVKPQPGVVDLGGVTIGPIQQNDSLLSRLFPLPGNNPGKSRRRGGR